MTDAVVVGAGVIGLGVAWRAATRGLRVTVVDDAPGRGASLAAAGMLAPVSELSHGEGALLPIGCESLRRYPGFVADLQAASGADVGLRPEGTLLVGLDGDDVVHLAEQHRLHATHGATSQRLTGRECRVLEPALSPRLRGGVHVPGDRSVSPRRLHAALVTACRRAGVRFVPRRVTALHVSAERLTGQGATAARVHGVVLDDGTPLAAGQVVLAAGSHSAGIGGVPAGEVPVRPVTGQVLRLRGEPLLERTVRALVRGRPVYLVPDGDGGLVVGATVEDRGRDDRVTAGAVLDLLRDAADVVPGVSELELTEVLARWRPATPDNLPVVGRSAVGGLVVATGHYRHGVLLAPLTADAVADLLTGRDHDPLLDPLRPSRFQNPGRFRQPTRPHPEEVPCS